MLPCFFDGQKAPPPRLLTHVKKKNVFLGGICREFLEVNPDKTLEALEMHLERFAIMEENTILDSIKLFYTFNSNIIPVLSNKEKYLGYIAYDDVFGELSKYPLFSENGAILTVETSAKSYSMTEIAKIVESNNGTLLGLFVSAADIENIEVTLKINVGPINEIIQTFRRYDYEIISEHQEDNYINTLKERSDYFDKYLNI